MNYSLLLVAPRTSYLAKYLSIPHDATVAGQEVGHLRKINAPIEQEGLFEGF